MSNGAHRAKFTTLLARWAVSASLLTLAAGLAVARQDAHPAPQPAQPAAQPAPTPTPATVAQPAMQAPEVVGPSIKREPPPMSAEPGTIALGFMDPETSATGKTVLKNTGDTDLKITRAQTSCSCTVASDLSNKVLKPGESVDLEATLKGGKFPGPQQKAVRVFVEGYAVPVQVWVTGEVAYGVKSTPVYVDCFQVRTGEITFESTDGKPFKILSVNCQTPPYVGFDPAKDEPRNKYTLKYDFQGVEDPALPHWWLVETDHPKAAVVDLRVINPALIPQQDPKAPWSLMEDRALVGVLRPGESKEIHVTLRPVTPPALDAAEPVLTFANDSLKAEFVGKENGAEGYVIKVKITAVKDMGACSLLNEKMKISWLGHENTYDVFGRVTNSKAAMKTDGPKFE